MKKKDLSSLVFLGIASGTMFASSCFAAGGPSSGFGSQQPGSSMMGNGQPSSWGALPNQQQGWNSQQPASSYSSSGRMPQDYNQMMQQQNNPNDMRNRNTNDAPLALWGWGEDHEDKDKSQQQRTSTSNNKNNSVPGSTWDNPIREKKPWPSSQNNSNTRQSNLEPRDGQLAMEDFSNKRVTRRSAGYQANDNGRILNRNTGNAIHSPNSCNGCKSM